MIAGNLAIFEITRILNHVKSYQRKVIEPVKDKSSRWIKMRATDEWALEGYGLHLDSLSFLFECSYPNILGDLSVAESNFVALKRAIDYRSELYIGSIMPRLERAGIQGSDPTTTIVQVEEALGANLSDTLKEATNQIIDVAERLVQAFESGGRDLNEVLQEFFPKEKLISFHPRSNDFI